MKQEFSFVLYKSIGGVLVGDLLLDFVDKIVNQVERRIDLVIEKKVGEFQLNSFEKPYMNKKEAAEYIGVSFNTFRKFERMGLPIIEVDGTLLVKKEDIDVFLEKNKH